MNRWRLVLVVGVIFVISACAPAPVPTYAPPTVPPTVTPVPTPTITLTPLPTATLAPTNTPGPTPTPSRTPTATAIPILRLSLWHAQGPQQQDGLANLIREFNRTHPYIQVTVISQNSPSTLLGNARGDGGPDLILAYPSEIASLVTAGAVMPLEDLMRDGRLGFSAQDMRDIYPAFIDNYPQARNRIYSLAFMRAMEVMYYNADLFKTAGFTAPPETWDDFAKMCAAIAKPPDVVCYQMNADAADFAGWVWSRGGDLIGADGRTVTFDRQPGLDALLLLNSLFRGGQAGRVIRAFQEPSDFAAGKVAFTFDSTMGLGFYDRAARDGNKVKEWGIALFPRAKGMGVNVYGPSLAILTNSGERQRAAFTLIKWLMEADTNAEWAKATGYLPARASTKARLASGPVSPQFRQAMEWLPLARAEPAVAGWNAVRNSIADAMVKVALGKALPEDALKEAAQQANQALASP